MATGWKKTDGIIGTFLGVCCRKRKNIAEIGNSLSVSNAIKFIVRMCHRRISA